MCLAWAGVESSPRCNCSSKYRVVWLEGVTRLQHGAEELGMSLSFPHLNCSYSFSQCPYSSIPSTVFNLHPYPTLFHTVLKKFEVEIEHPPHITTSDEEFQLVVCGKWVHDTIVISALWLHCHIQIAQDKELVFHLSVRSFCITLRLGETDHTLEWAPCHTWSLTVRLKDIKDAGCSGWRGMQNYFKGWAKVPEQTWYKAKLHWAPLPLMRMGGVLYQYFCWQSADCFLVNVSLFWHRYTYGKPVQGKVEITVMTRSQDKKGNSTSSAIQRQNSWVGEQIEDQKVSGNVFLPP